MGRPLSKPRHVVNISCSAKPLFCPSDGYMPKCIHSGEYGEIFITLLASIVASQNVEYRAGQNSGP